MFSCYGCSDGHRSTCDGHTHLADLSKVTYSEFKIYILCVLLGIKPMNYFENRLPMWNTTHIKINK